MATTDDILKIIKTGGGVSLDAATRTTTDLISIARLAHEKEATVFIRNAGGMPQADLVAIARAGQKYVIIGV